MEVPYSDRLFTATWKTVNVSHATSTYIDSLFDSMMMAVVEYGDEAMPQVKKLFDDKNCLSTG